MVPKRADTVSLSCLIPDRRFGRILTQAARTASEVSSPQSSSFDTDSTLASILTDPIGDLESKTMLSQHEGRLSRLNLKPMDASRGRRKELNSDYRIRRNGDT